MWTLVIAQAVAMTFVTVAQGSSSQIQDSREVVLRSAAEWEELWSAHSPQPPPAVDFSESLVAGVFLGMRQTAGYEVEVTAARAEGDRVVVEYVEHRPASDALVAQVLTSPFHFVRLPREVGSIAFRKLTAQGR
jgi:hypothetical protein